MENAKNKYGAFTSDGREFTVSRMDTPRPWMNVLFNDEYGVFFSQTGEGYSFYKSVLYCPVTYCDVFTYVPQWPQTGKFVYLRDMDKGSGWSLAPFFADQEYDSFLCRHCPGRSEIQTLKNGIRSTFGIVVPPGTDPVELWDITFRNESEEKRRLRIYPFQELQMSSYGSSATDVFTYTIAKFDPSLQAIVAHNNNSVSKLKYRTFTMVDYPVVGWDCRLESFIGTYGRKEMPAVVQRGECTGSEVSAERMCTVLEGEIELAPGEQKQVNLLFGIGSDEEDVAAFRKTYLSAGKPEDARNRTQVYWDAHYERMHADTPFTGLDWLLNSWYKHGALLTSRFVRGDIKGFRDIVQDIMGMCPLEPGWTRRWLLESLKHQEQSGHVIRCYDVIAGEHDMRRHRDCGLWLPITFSEYIRETGDDSILDEVVSYLDGGEDSAWMHMVRNILCVGQDRGAHDLCLIGDGDWNDSLDEINREGRGESAWLTVACIHAINLMEEIGDNTGRQESLDELRNLREELRSPVEESAWDGDWYVYGFADDGRAVGSSVDREGQVHLNMQTWAIFAGVAAGERQEKLLDLIDHRMDSDFGPLLIDPAYTAYDNQVGKMSAKNPGHCENGPVYSHGVCFKMLADAVLGRGNQAMDSFIKLSPFNPKTSQDRFAAVPFAAPRYLVSRANPEQEGAAWYPYFTATPAWMMTVLWQHILGIRPWYDGLVIDPVIPSEWDGFTVTRTWRDATYKITVNNPEHVCCGVAQLEAGGERVDGQLLRPAVPGSKISVRCTLGRFGKRFTHEESL